MRELDGRKGKVRGLLRVKVTCPVVVVHKMIFLPSIYPIVSRNNDVVKFLGHTTPFLWTEYINTLLSRTSIEKRVYVSASFLPRPSLTQSSISYPTILCCRNSNW